jgi:D-glycero-alpha-D-manno-heptose-7-phosphate kinase
MVALIALLSASRSLSLTDYEVAELAYDVERSDLGVLGGRQDQYAAVFGGFNYLELDGDRVIVNSLRVPPDVVLELEHNMLLAYTGPTRQGDEIIADQTARFESGDEDTVAGLRAAKALSVEMKDALLQRNPHDFGLLLNAAWEAKKRLSPRITTGHVDELYEAALKVGALGGLMTGAGGGGYMLFYCRYDRKHRVADRLTELGAVVTEFAFEADGLRTWRAEDLKPSAGASPTA